MQLLALEVPHLGFGMTILGGGLGGGVGGLAVPRLSFRDNTLGSSGDKKVFSPPDCGWRPGDPFACGVRDSAAKDYSEKTYLSPH